MSHIKETMQLVANADDAAQILQHHLRCADPHRTGRDSEWAEEMQKVDHILRKMWEYYYTRYLEENPS